MTKRFIVVDPSFTSHDGDRWQYAVNLAQSANVHGYEFVLLTHETAPDISRTAGIPIETRPIFKHTFYQHDRIHARHHVAEPRRRSAKGGAIGDRTTDAPRHRGAEARSGKQFASLALLRGRLAARSIVGRLTDWVSVKFRRNQECRVTPFNRDDFAISLARELRRLAPGRDDILFFHTMTYGMMESLSEVTSTLGHAPPFDTTAYFLFHFGANSPDARTYLDRYYSYSAYGSIADRMRVGAPFARLHFLATSAALQEEAREILGAEVGLWDGLVNLRYFEDCLGGAGAITHRRAHAKTEIGRGEIRAVVRAADLDEEKARAVSRACHLVQSRGNVVRLRILYHAGVLGTLRDLLQRIDFPNVELIDTTANETYLSEICDAGVALLPYDPDKYDKRVSAFLHDCAVLGVPAIVPYGSTLADCEFATTFVYGSTEDMLGCMLNAVRYLQSHPDAAETTVEEARSRLAGDPIERLQRSSPRPSVERSGPSRLANVVMPLWGRAGSSCVFEGQIRLLLNEGYFVNQVFLMDQPVNPLDATEYFWKMLRENSVNARGSIQRIAFFEAARANALPESVPSSAFDQLMRRINRCGTEDPLFDEQVRRADLTIVNHVFNSEWARTNAGGKRILETHDIQSYQLAAAPLINERTGQAEPFRELLSRELSIIGQYDHVVNLSREEHLILSEANRRSSLVLPYVPTLSSRKTYKDVSHMGKELGLHESYHYEDEFDILIAGDSHPANVESVTWFINEVFNPYIVGNGLNLVLAGRVSNAIYERLGEIPYIYYLGFVDDLEAIKALSRLVVLPDRRGTGVSIKTLETLASGMPFVATSLAFRGFRHRLPGDLRTYDNPREFADAILSALEAPSHLASLRTASKTYYQALASRAQYDLAWQDILRRVGA